MAKHKDVKVGRPRNIESKEILLKYWDEYKSHIDNNLDSEDIVTVKGSIVQKKSKKPYLKQGFESFVFRNYGISIKDYLLPDKYPEFSDVTTCIRNEWEDDQISGTLTGRYKAPNLTARLNGLTEKSENIDTIKIEHITGMEIK
jgi:hypothetical protein